MNVLEKLVKQNRLPVLFIGSGIPKRYLENYPSWSELLEYSFKKISNDEYEYLSLYDQLSRKFSSEFDIYTELGSAIEDRFNEAFFKRKIKIGSSKNPTWIKKKISPYKMFLALYFKNMAIKKDKALSKELDELKKLKNKISAIITTNYDLFLENIVFPNDYTVFTRQNELFSANSYNSAEIYKIHGSASDADSIIITKDYDNFINSRKLIIAKMLTLFADSPIIFIGYSFTDEDVQGVISDFLECLTNKELKNIDQHFVFISYKKGENKLLEHKRSITTRNGAIIPFTEIQTDNFYKVYNILNNFVPGISPKRIRETKRLVKNIVDSTISNADADAIIIGIDDLENTDYSDKPLAIAIGYKENILSNYGYLQITDDMIVEDILFNNKNLNATAMCLHRFNSLSISRIMPVFKYIKSTTEEIPSNSKLAKYVELHNSIEKIISNKVKRNFNKQPIFTNINDLSTAITKEVSLHKKYGMLMINMENFEISETRKICQELFHENRVETVKSSIFKRCVMYIDFIENYTEKS